MEHNSQSDLDGVVAAYHGDKVWEVPSSSGIFIVPKSTYGKMEITQTYGSGEISSIRNTILHCFQFSENEARS